MICVVWQCKYCTTHSQHLLPNSYCQSEYKFNLFPGQHRHLSFLSMTMFLFFFSPLAKFQITVGNRTMTMQKICQCPNLEIPRQMLKCLQHIGEKFFTQILSQAEKPRIHLPQGFGGRGVTTPYTAYRFSAAGWVPIFGLLVKSVKQFQFWPFSLRWGKRFCLFEIHINSVDSSFLYFARFRCFLAFLSNLCCYKMCENNTF